MSENNKSGKNGSRSFRVAMNTFSYVILIVGISLILATFIILVSNDMFALVKEDRQITLELTGETSTGDVAKMLRENELIRYSWAFSLFAKMKNNDNFPAGKYALNSNMDYGQMIDTFNRVTSYADIIKLTIPEGYTLAQIAKLLEDNLVCSAKEFTETANTYPFAHEVLKDVPIKENRLEGYLFPDTYEFYKNEKPKYVLNKMLNNFENRYTDEMRTMTSEAGMSVAEVVNIASLIEKEAKLDEDRTMISGVIHNRLDSTSLRKLQVDAALLYVVGHKEALTNEDLALDSPYNTYLYEGLPPTAICNPGIKSLLAAISPKKHKYYYYVVNPETGGHVFSKTAEEHAAAVAQMKELEKKIKK